MKRLIFPIVVLIVLILVATFVYQAVSGPPKLLQMPEAKAEANTKVGVSKTEVPLPKVGADFDWAELDEADLNELLEAVNDSADQPRHREEFSVVLAEGESLITEGFEREPGVFEFSQLSAETIVIDNSEAIAITAERFEVSLNGEAKVLSLPRIMTRPGVAATIQSGVSDSSGKMLAGFKLEITPERVEGGISLHGVLVDH